MGGNVVFGEHKADRITFETGINNVQRVAADLIGKVALQVEGGYPVPSGSTRHLFKYEGVAGHRHLTDVVKSIGDVDVLIDRKPTIAAFEDQTRINKMKRDGMFDFKRSGDQFITLWDTPIGNVQLDLEMADFVDGKPQRWDQWIRASAEEDYVRGLKGVAHNYLWRALTSLSVRCVDDESLTLMNEYAFSLNGLRRKFILNWDEERGHTHKLIPSKGLQPNDYCRDPGMIWALLTKSSTLEGNPWHRLGTTVGLANAIHHNLDRRERNVVFEAFVEIASDQQLYRDDPVRHHVDVDNMLDTVADVFEYGYKD